MQRNVDDHVAGRTPRLEHEYRILLPDGSVRWIQTRGQCFRDADGRPVRMAGASIVITERKRAEEALRQSEQRYQLAITGVNQGVWDWDLASDMVFMSARAQELLGHGSPATQVRPRREWIAHWEYHPEDRVRVRQALADYLQRRDRERSRSNTGCDTRRVRGAGITIAAWRCATRAVVLTAWPVRSRT